MRANRRGARRLSTAEPGKYLVRILSARNAPTQPRHKNWPNTTSGLRLRSETNERRRINMQQQNRSVTEQSRSRKGSASLWKRLSKEVFQPNTTGMVFQLFMRRNATSKGKLPTS